MHTGDTQPICPRCSYPLAGLNERGHCPECGLEYTFESARVHMYMPTGRGMLLALALPLALLALSIALSYLLGWAGLFDEAGFVALFIPVALIWMCIATPIVLARAASFHRAAGGWGRWWKRYGAIVALIRIVSLLNIIIMTILILGLGTCVAIIMTN